MKVVPHAPRPCAAGQFDADAGPQRGSASLSQSTSRARRRERGGNADLRTIASERRAEIESAIVRWTQVAAPQPSALRAADRRLPRTDGGVTDGDA